MNLKKTSWSPRLLSLAGGAAVLGTVLTGTAVHAATGDSGGVTPAILAQAGSDTQDADRQAKQEELLQQLADRLGIDVEALRSAVKDVAIARIDARLAAGEITQEQADAAKARIEAGDLGLHIGGGHGKHGHGGGFRGAALSGEEMAAFLGITHEELHAALVGGQTLAQVAEANGKSRDELKAFIMSELKADLDEAVAAGRLTQEEADAKLAERMANLDAVIDGTAPGPRGPRGAGFRGMPAPAGNVN